MEQKPDREGRRETMLITTHQQFSDTAIRRFLLGELRGRERTAFERTLFSDSWLEQRTRLAEIAFADDYALGRLPAKERKSFVENFPLSAARRQQIEVSRALGECFAPTSDDSFVETSHVFGHVAWKWAFASIVLIMLFATIWVVTKEPRIVRFMAPHVRPHAAATTPTPEVSHHAEGSTEPRAHQDKSPAPPPHEAGSDAIVLNSATSADNAPLVTLAKVNDKNVPVQLMLDEASQSAYRAELLNSSGEVVYTEEGLTPGADRIDFNIPTEHLAAGDFQIRLTRVSDGKLASYYLRVK